jgi:Ca2+-transporting ATPase
MDASALHRTPAHALEVTAVCARLHSSPAGLAGAEAAHRLATDGPNALQDVLPPSPWRLLAAQLSNVLILILLAATALSALLGHRVEAIAITVIVLFAVLLGFVQELRAERALRALQALSAPRATVLRDGEPTEIASREVVRGDVLLLATGQRVPADARLLEAVQLTLDEAALTGESVAVDKDAHALCAADAPTAERGNMVFAGTAVARGRGRALVTATAMDTEFGRIATLLQSVQATRTPLQRTLDRLAAQLARAALVVVLVIVGLGLARGQPFLEMLVFGIALAVAVVPEALPAVVTISLALGVQRMARRGALVRQLAAVETLGSTSVICSDKTGTLTRDEMTLRQIVIGDTSIEVTGAGYAPTGTFMRDGAVIATDGALADLLRAAALCGDTQVVRQDEAGRRDDEGRSDGRGNDGGGKDAGATDGSANEVRWHAQGDPTEAALVVAAAKAGLHKAALEAQCPRVGEIPFSSEARTMTTLHAVDGGVIAFTKGAPEVVLAACTRCRTAAGIEALDETRAAALLAAAQSMAARALRVLALAERSEATLDNAAQDLTLLGLVGLMDPPREEARAAIAACRSAGVRVVMITGDHPVTAQAVAHELGLVTDAVPGRVATGRDLDTLDDAALGHAVREIVVYARVSPAHKLRVVRALQAHGDVVAMTGDGVNDAPALKQADIGVAMGRGGTDVAREAAAMTLVDDNFATIVAAVQEGRGIYANIRKYLLFLLSSNIGEIGLMAAAALAGLPLPLSAVQLLYVNLATDGLPALALAVDPQERDVMQRPPRHARARLFTRPIVALLMVAGLWTAAVNAALFAWALDSGRSAAQAMTLTFATLVLIQFFNAYNFRSPHGSALRAPFANRWLNLAVAWEVALLFVVVHWSVLQPAFGTVDLDLADWLLVLACAVSIVPVMELAKRLLRPVLWQA